MLASAWLTNHRPAFAPPVLREEALLVLLIAGVVVGMAPTVAQGWQSAVALNMTTDTGARRAALPVWMLSFVGASVALGGLWSCGDAVEREYSGTSRKWSVRARPGAAVSGDGAAVGLRRRGPVHGGRLPGRISSRAAASAVASILNAWLQVGPVLGAGRGAAAPAAGVAAQAARRRRAGAAPTARSTDGGLEHLVLDARRAGAAQPDGSAHAGQGRTEPRVCSAR